MLSINTNLSSLIAQSSLKESTNLLNRAVERMTTGYKINGAKDNAANFSISTNMTTKIGAYRVAEDNTAMGLDMLTTASESLASIEDKLARLHSLATQASNGTYGPQSLNAINSEANALVDEISRLYSTAEYNGVKLFNNPSAPAAAAFAARAAVGGYSEAEIAAMTTITKASELGAFEAGKTYSISSVEELETFRDMVNAGNSGAGSTFVLTKDLDLSSISNWTPIGNDINNMHIFSGSFDGNGHVISNLTINDTSGFLQGLFGIVGSLTGDYVEIKKLGLENVNIQGGVNVGGIAGYALANLYNNFVTGSVSGIEHVGGLVGYALSGSGRTSNLEHNYSSVNVSGTDCVGGVVGMFEYDCAINLNNNYASGNVSGTNYVGGVVGRIESRTSSLSVITNNYASGNVSGTDCVGGVVGFIYLLSSSATLSNNSSIGNVTGSSKVGGCIGGTYGTPTITNCASVQADNYATQKTAEEILSPANLEAMGFTESNGWTIVNGTPTLTWQLNRSSGGALNGSNQVLLQIGIGAGTSSQISFDLGVSLGSVDDLRMIGLDNTTDFLSVINEMLATVSAKEVEYGAVTNRLESALDEIAIQYDNLVSSRSTLRDADIAKESSKYIQAQILQQASSTLLATANQSPSVALALI